MDVGSRTRFFINFPDQIEQQRVHSGGFVTTPVAQEAVYLLQAALNIFAVTLIGDRGFFAGVEIIKLEAAGRGLTIGCEC